MHNPVVVVVGAGFSGVLTALSLLEAPGSRARVHLIEQADRFGVGKAFGARQPDHLLNVRAMNMSADPDAPDDFTRWLGVKRGAEPEPFAFASRADYGAYIQARLRQLVQSKAAVGRLDMVGDTAVAVRPRDGGFEVALGLGRVLSADCVVLATGNPPPSDAALPDPRLGDHPAYVRDPWAADALKAIDPDDTVLMLGVGLTMVDVLASLDARGHAGPVLALSRRGLPPQRHARVVGKAGAWRREPNESLSVSLARLRRDADQAGDWREIFDALRSVTQDHWKAMSLTERRRFLRHLRPWWDSHRHRLAPAMADRLDGWLNGRLQIVAGRLRALEPADEGLAACWTPRGAKCSERRVVRHVINCTGPEGDPRRSTAPLMRQLLRDGLIRPDPLGLGMEADGDGALIGADGTAHARLFAVGPAARGALWEITAVPDIRVEARRLGQTLARLDT